MLIVGSHALAAAGIKLGRSPSDLDAIGTKDDFHMVRASLLKTMPSNFDMDCSNPRKAVLKPKGGKPIEIEFVDQSESGAFFHEHAPRFKKDGKWYATPDAVLALKLSHRYLKNSPHFRKTMDDILALRGLGHFVPEELKGEWMKLRERETYTYKHPSLNQGKKTFFSGDGVDYKWEHDDIHAALATLPKLTGAWSMDDLGTAPAYAYFQADGAEVKTSKEKFHGLPEHVKLLSVLEESYVLALERSQVPNDFKIAPRTSFLQALEKVCTSITSGWWREYAWENYHKVLAMYSDEYVQKFKVAVAHGRIRPYQGGEK